MAGRISAGTERAIRRHLIDGEPITTAARAEGIDPSTLFRALGRLETAQKTPRYVIAGAGALGREVAGWLRRDGIARIVFLNDLRMPDDFPWEVVATFDSYDARRADRLLVAVADPAAREKALERLSAEPATYISSTAVVGAARIGPGCMLLPGAIVSADATLGRSVLVNVHSTIGHDVVLGDFCTLSAQVDLTGRVRVGRSVFFGSGARVIPGIQIGDGATIGAGAVVIRDVPPGATVSGNPARIIT